MFEILAYIIMLCICGLVGWIVRMNFKSALHDEKQFRKEIEDANKKK